MTHLTRIACALFATLVAVPCTATNARLFMASVDGVAGSYSGLVPGHNIVGYTSTDASPRVAAWSDRGFFYQGVLGSGVVERAFNGSFNRFGNNWSVDIIIGERDAFAFGTIKKSTTNFKRIIRDGLEVDEFEPRQTRISPFFRPKFEGVEIPLEILADAMGFDGFNWYQEVTLPDDLTAYIGTLGTDGRTLIGATPFGSQTLEDPSTELPDRIAFASAATGKVELLYVPGLDGMPGRVPDDLPFYLNLDQIEEYDLTTLTGGRSLEPVSIHMTDRPGLPATLGYRDGQYLQFRTEIVGYRNNGEMIRTGVGFTWKSNAIVDSTGEVFDLAYLSVPDLPGFPPIIAGGVFDLQLFGVVPEPTSFVLVGPALVGLFVRSRRRGK